jgi:hypothetical protein
VALNFYGTALAEECIVNQIERGGWMEGGLLDVAMGMEDCTQQIKAGDAIKRPPGSLPAARASRWARWAVPCGYIYMGTGAANRANGSGSGQDPQMRRKKSGESRWGEAVVSWCSNRGLQSTAVQAHEATESGWAVGG